MPTWVTSAPDRLDAFLATDGRMRSRTLAQDSITQGFVTVNDEVIHKPAFRLQEGDVVALTQEEEASSNDVVPMDLNLEVLFEDENCFVINKPEGLMVHPGLGMAPGEPTVLHGLAFIFQKKKLPFSAGHVLAHRLDKDTSGALLCAKTPEVHLRLQEQFQERTVEKFYLALVAGIPSPPEAMIDAPIGRSAHARTTMSVTQVSAARDARTTYRTLQTSGKIALLECELHTGRTHQIRVHLSSIGHPILGDGTYTNEMSQRLRDELEINHMYLHAWKLRFDSPGKGRVDIKAPLPEYWSVQLKKLEMSVK